MKKLISCEYNFDTCCVELKFSDGSMIAIDTFRSQYIVVMGGIFAYVVEIFTNLCYKYYGNLHAAVGG